MTTQTITLTIHTSLTFNRTHLTKIHFLNPNPKMCRWTSINTFTLNIV